MLIENIINEFSNKNKSYKIIAILPGRFQPPHIGHVKSWEWLSDKFYDAYIVTSNKVDPPRSPFTFQEKKEMFIYAGIPSDHIIQVREPYKATELVSQFDADNTVVLFGVSKKDMDENPRFSFKPKKDGSQGFLQPYDKNIDNLKPVSQHAYIITVPTLQFTVGGIPMKSATDFRKRFADASNASQAKMITDLYGKYSDRIHALMRNRIK